MKLAKIPILINSSRNKQDSSIMLKSVIANRIQKGFSVRNNWNFEKLLNAK
jgi:hypothetical protein